MKTKLAIVAVLALVLLTWAFYQYGWAFYRYQSTACKVQGKEYSARVEKLKRDARERLRIGTNREQVVQFFRDNGLPVSFDTINNEYEGTIYTKGCAPAGCGSDDALLGLRVKVDSSGMVVGEPIIGAIYTNCL